MTSPVPPLPRRGMSFQALERMASEVRPAARSFLVVDPGSFDRLFSYAPTIDLEPGAVNFHRSGWLFGMPVIRSPISLGLAEPEPMPPAPREHWRARLMRRLGLVPWVVWATIVAAIELLCLLMAARP